MNRTADRLLGIDVIRWFSFYAIVVFHLTYALWAREGDTALPIHGPWVWPLENYARLLATSGFHVLFLSFFLFGRSNLKRNLVPLLLAFAVVWWVVTEDFPYYWDIYPFLLVAGGAVWLLEKSRVSAKGVAFVSAIAMTLPYWKFELLLLGPQPWTAPLIGSCGDAGDLGDWPIFPWIFYVTWAWSLGRLSSSHATKLSRLSRQEAIAWSLLLLCSIPFLGAYFQTPVGEEFGCYAFRQPAIVFLSHHLWLLALIRLSFVTEIKESLGKNPVVQWFVHSPVNQRFYVVYFAHYLGAFFIAWAAHRTGLHHEAWILAASFAIIFVSVEWVWRKANESLLTISKPRA